MDGLLVCYSWYSENGTERAINVSIMETVTRRNAVTIRFHDSYNIVLGSDGYLYILSHFGCLPNASLDWPV